MWEKGCNNCVVFSFAGDATVHLQLNTEDRSLEFKNVSLQRCTSEAHCNNARWVAGSQRRMHSTEAQKWRKASYEQIPPNPGASFLGGKKRYFWNSYAIHFVSRTLENNLNPKKIREVFVGFLHVPYLVLSRVPSRNQRFNVKIVIYLPLHQWLRENNR